VTFKIEARRVGILPHRVHSVVMRERSSEQAVLETRGTQRNPGEQPGLFSSRKTRKRKAQPKSEGRPAYKVRLW
jgi:single-strand DNA-binding protein